MSTKSNISSVEVLKQLEKTYWAVEKKITPLIVNELNKELRKPLNERSWITEICIKSKSGQEIQIGKLVKELFLFRSKLTALRVGIEFIPNLKTELTWDHSNQNNTLETIASLLKSFKGKSDEATKILEKLRQNFNNKIIFKSHKKYPDNQFYSTSYNPESIVTEYVEDKIIWTTIFEDINIDKIFNSLILKIHAVNLIEKTKGSKTSGVDDICFRNSIKIASISTKMDEEILKELKQIHPAFKLKTLAKRSNNLVIQRKGEAISPNKRLRAALQRSTLGKTIVKMSKIEFNKMKSSPKKYITEHNALAAKFNLKLKYDLLNGLKYNALLKYKSNDILRVMITKSNGKLRPVGILSIYDRLIQKFVLIIMEPYMEPIGDRNSWGFRSGRSASHAITQIAQILQWKSNNELNQYKNKMRDSLSKIRTKHKASKINTPTDAEMVKIKFPRPGKRSIRKNIPKNLSCKKRKKIVSHIKYVLDADIKGCFENISHDWLLKWVPISELYKSLLYKILKTNIVEKSIKQDNWMSNVLKPWSKYTWLHWSIFKHELIFTENKYNQIQNSEENNKGISQGGIISPLLMNWTLDGLSYIARNGSVTNHTNRKIITTEKLAAEIKLNKKNKKLKKKINLLTSTHLIRFADDFLFITSNPDGIENAMGSIKRFLEIRGLELSDEKTKIIRMTMGRKFNYLGWTFHMFSPKKINWLTNVAHSISTRLKDRTKLYIYPSNNNTKSFRNKIKEATSRKFINLRPQELIRKLNPIIWGWSNYFLPSLNQSALRSRLDNYIFTRCKKWCYKKYGGESYAAIIKILFYDTAKNKWYRSMTVGSSKSKTTLSVKSLRKLSASVLFLCSNRITY